MTSGTLYSAFQVILLSLLGQSNIAHTSSNTLCFPPCVHGRCILLHYAPVSVVGRAVTHPTLPICQCDEGYSGTSCNVLGTACIVNRCMNGAWCIPQSVDPFYTCVCNSGYTGAHCEIQHAINTTTTGNYKSCDKVTVVTQIAGGVSVNNELAGMCSTGTRSTPEALVIVHCGVQELVSWYRGAHVMDHCSEIPTYTPVAAFPAISHSTHSGAWSGVFLGCINGGFRMAMQQCGKPAEILHVVSGGAGNLDPASYYIIQ